MPIFRLVDEPIFPPPDYADPSGLLAVGGDLSSERLLEAYRLEYFLGIRTTNRFSGGHRTPG